LSTLRGRLVAAADGRAHPYAFRSVIGESLALRQAVELALRVALHPGTTVLLTGETGTGKELFARGIHYAGGGGGEAFVAVNCSAIPSSLLESELFGHEKGAFTDAHTDKMGLLELAGGGTVFLDEISELPLELQPKLLRVLEEKRVRRLGGLEERPFACRVVVASNRDLGAAVAAGKFREDLFYRLNVFRIELPPLRQREQDVILLARHFLATICRDSELAPRTFSAEAELLLARQPWPGNVRELKNTVERAVILSDGDRIGAEHILVQRRSHVPAAEAAALPPAGVIAVPPEGLSLCTVERELIAITLRLTGNNQTRAARLLGISRPTVIRKIRKYGLAD
jgi:two-component system, NtrC family, response regulator AtoC